MPPRVIMMDPLGVHDYRAPDFSGSEFLSLGSEEFRTVWALDRNEALAIGTSNGQFLRIDVAGNSRSA